MRWVLTVCRKTKTHSSGNTPSAFHLKANKEFNKLLISKKNLNRLNNLVNYYLKEQEKFQPKFKFNRVSCKMKGNKKSLTIIHTEKLLKSNM